jgi:hypothetical protein
MKTKYIFAAMAVMVAASSCTEDWLATESHDAIYIDEYYNTEARINEALVAAYNPMLFYDYNGSSYNGLSIVFGVLADELYPGGESPSDNVHYHHMFNFEVQPTDAHLGIWTQSYEGVNRANAVAQYMPGVADISDDSKARILAEAVVLRTWYYNMLWKVFGNIPYYEVNLGSDYIIPQTPADEVYTKLVEGLEPVLESSALPMRVTDAAMQGRVSWAMAAMLYAEIVMYQNDQGRYSKALGYMERIISSSQYDLIDYATLFEVEGEWSAESIFELNYFSEGAYRSWGGPKNAGGTVMPRTMGPSNLAGHARYDGGWGTGPMRTDAAAAFSDGDLRKAVTVADLKGEGASYDPRYQDTGFFLAKYLPRKGGNAGQIADADLNYNSNLRIYRFAETLLNAAELGSPSAQLYLDRVRNRAGLGSVTANAENILAERRLEFMGEGKRYSDLVRTGKAASVLTPTGDPNGGQDNGRKNSWTANKKYLPIPQSEIDASQGTLVQNNY